MVCLTTPSCGKDGLRQVTGDTPACERKQTTAREHAHPTSHQKQPHMSELAGGTQTSKSRLGCREHRWAVASHSEVLVFLAEQDTNKNTYVRNEPHEFQRFTIMLDCAFLNASQHLLVWSAANHSLGNKTAQHKVKVSQVNEIDPYV